MEQQDEKRQETSHITLRSILGGDILAHDWLKRQAKLLVLIVILTFLYIDNRYACQQELTDIKYDALTISSELTEKSRQSRIEEFISKEGTPLETAATPPYLIKEK